MTTKELNAELIESYLAEVRVYRTLVSLNAHRGRKPPAPPRYLTSPSAATSTVAQSAKVERSLGSVVGQLKERVLDIRIVPWNTVARVRDKGDRESYDELWKPGCFAKQIGDGDKRVYLNHEHGKGLAHVIGHALQLRDEPDGLHGSFRILSGSDGDKALELVQADVLTGASLEARVLRSARNNGIVERHQALLDGVALCRRPAFASAGVVGVRSSHGDE